MVKLKSVSEILKEPETETLQIIEFINILQNMSGRSNYADIIKWVEYLDYQYRMEFTCEDLPDYKYLKQ